MFSKTEQVLTLWVLCKDTIAHLKHLNDYEIHLSE